MGLFDDIKKPPSIGTLLRPKAKKNIIAEPVSNSPDSTNLPRTFAGSPTSPLATPSALSTDSSIPALDHNPVIINHAISDQQSSNASRSDSQNFNHEIIDHAILDQPLSESISGEKLDHVEFNHAIFDNSTDAEQTDSSTPVKFDHVILNQPILDFLDSALLWQVSNVNPPQDYFLNPLLAFDFRFYGAKQYQNASSPVESFSITTESNSEISISEISFNSSESTPAKSNHEIFNHAKVDHVNSTHVNFDHVKNDQLTAKENLVIPAKSNHEIFHQPDKRPHTAEPLVKSHYTTISNSYFTETKNLRPVEHVIFLLLYRYSYGWKKSETIKPLSPNYIQAITGISRNTVKKSLKSLFECGLIKESKTISNLGSHYTVKLIGCAENDPSLLKNNYSKIDNRVLDHVLPNLASSDFIVYFYLYLQSYAKNSTSTEEFIRPSQLLTVINVSERTYHAILGRLINTGYIERNGPHAPSGHKYQVNIPVETAQAPETDVAKTNHAISNHEKSAHAKNASYEENFAPAKIDQAKNKLLSSNDLNEKNVLQSKIAPVKTDHNKTEKLLKTSSGDDDEILDFRNLISGIFSNTNRFVISEASIKKYFNTYGVEVCKKHIVRLKDRLLQASSPVGFWITSLKHPENYPELTQKNEPETVEEKRAIEEKARQARLAAEQEKKRQEELRESAWNALNQEDQSCLTVEAEEYYLSIMDGKLPPRRAILEKAQILNFERVKQVRE